MARGDKTGPMGQGSMTGRSLGYCADYDSPGFTRGFGGGRKQGRGFGGATGRGRDMVNGRGYGLHAGYSNTPAANSNDEILNLKAQAESLKQAQQEIERRLKDIEKK